MSRVRAFLLPTLVACLAPLALGSCGTDTVTLDESDNDTTVALRVGQELHVWLGGMGSVTWGAPRIDSTTDAVRFLDSDTCRHPGGLTPAGNYECLYRFEAAAVGTATITVRSESQGVHLPSFSVTVTVAR